MTEREDLYQLLIDHCGEEAAAAVILHFGGMQIFVPRHWTETHFLNSMGEKYARVLVEHFGGNRIEVPRSSLSRQKRTAMIVRMHERGENKNAIARRTRCTHRWVRKVLARAHHRNPDQGQLF